MHEPFLPFGLRPKLLAAAAVHRVMMVTLLRVAQHVWVATPAWASMLRPYTLGRDVPTTWLPEPASVPVNAAARTATAEIRARLLPNGGSLIGSFSTDSPFAREMLAAAIPPVLAACATSALLLVGAGSTRAREVIGDRVPPGRIHATGALDGADISGYLSACDVAAQPYLDGVCTRHSSAMTVLAHGVPMVTTGGRFTEEIWRASRAAALVPPGDGVAMAAAIERLLADPEERAGQRRRALELYDARFDIRHTVAALLGAPQCA